MKILINTLLKRAKSATVTYKSLQSHVTMTIYRVGYFSVC
jgi:hypothetical protein